MDVQKRDDAQRATGAVTALMQAMSDGSSPLDTLGTLFGEANLDQLSSGMMTANQVALTHLARVGGIPKGDAAVAVRSTAHLLARFDQPEFGAQAYYDAARIGSLVAEGVTTGSPMSFGEFADDHLRLAMGSLTLLWVLLHTLGLMYSVTALETLQQLSLEIASM